MDECECVFEVIVTIVRASLTKNGRRNYSISLVKFAHVENFRNKRLLNLLENVEIFYWSQDLPTK